MPDTIHKSILNTHKQIVVYFIMIFKNLNDYTKNLLTLTH